MSFKGQVKLFAKKFVGIGELSDSELMKLVEEGNSMAFEYVYETHKTPLYNFLLRTAKGDRELCFEIMQDTFMKAHQKAVQFKEGASLRNWLFSIAKNGLIDHYRKADALNHLSFYADDEESQGVEELSFHLDGPESELMKKVEKDQVAHCVGALKENQRMAVSMRMYSELSYDEIATHMETTVGSIKSLLNRAKKSLLNCLKGFLEESEK